MHSLLVPALTFVAYALLAGYFWRAQARGEGDVMSHDRVGHLILVPLTLHGYLIGQDIFAGGDFDLGVLNALSLIVWLTLLVYWVARFFYPIGGFQALLLPLAAVTMLLAVTAIASIAGPAWRATRIDPAVALRQE